MNRIKLFSALLVFLALMATSTYAQVVEAVTFNSVQLNANCSSVTVVYTPNNGGLTEPFTLYVYRESDLVTLGNQFVPSDNTQHTVTVALSQTLTNGQVLVVNIVSSGGLFENTPVTCGAGNSNNAGSNSANQVVPRWSGYSDGRINPDPAEAYTIFCGYDWVFIYGSDPTVNTQLIARVSIGILVTMPNGATITIDDWRISRSNNTIVIQGRNGYYAPEWRSKTFSLVSCIAGNTSGIVTDIQPDVSRLDYTWANFCRSGGITVYGVNARTFSCNVSHQGIVRSAN